MTVGSVTAASATTNPTTSATKPAADPSSLDYHAFMQLLIAQLKTQDPTKPMDSGQFMAQKKDAKFKGIRKEARA